MRRRYETIEIVIVVKQQCRAVALGGPHAHFPTQIPKEWKAQLKEGGVRTGRSIIHHSVSAPDGTRKFLLQLSDGRIVECVGIPIEAADDDSGEGERRARLTVCVSSQVSFGFGCLRAFGVLEQC